MTSFFFKSVFLNSLLFSFASFEPSLGAVDNDGEAALRDMAGSRSNRTHGWQLVGGNVVYSPKDYNFYALIKIHEKDDQFRKTCTGTIISKNIVVTAANCVCDLAMAKCPVYKAKYIRVYVGSTYLNNIEKDGNVYYVSLVRRHPKFKLSRNVHITYTEFKFDLAVIKIKSYFLFSESINKINLPNDEIIRYIPKWEGNRALCTAYGLDTSIGNIYSNEDTTALDLFYADMKLVKFEDCLTRWRNKGFQVMLGDHICATGYGRSVCMSDNGGGLRIFYDNDWYLIGVATLTENCGSESLPSVFTRVDAALDFFQDYIEEDVKSSPSSGDFIHNQLVTQYYCGPLSSVFILTIVFKSEF